MLEDVEATHPQLLSRAGVRSSDRFEDPGGFIRRRTAVERPPADAAVHRIETPTDVPLLRRAARTHARRAGLAPDRVEDLELAVSEIVANALVHGRTPRRMSLYVADQAVVCLIHDGGAGIPNPLLGYLPPGSEAPGGRGLWIAHQACDVVEVGNGPEGTDVWLRMHP